MTPKVFISCGYHLGQAYPGYPPEWGKERRNTLWEGFLQDIERVKNEGLGWVIAGNLFEEEYISESVLHRIFSLLAEVQKPVWIVPGAVDPAGDGSPYSCWELPDNIRILHSPQVADKCFGTLLRGFSSASEFSLVPPVKEKEVWIFSYEPKSLPRVPSDYVALIIGNSRFSRILSQKPTVIQLAPPFRFTPSTEPFVSSLWWNVENAGVEFVPGESRLWASFSLSFPSSETWKRMEERVNAVLSSLKAEDFVEIMLTGFHSESLDCEDCARFLQMRSPRVFLKDQTLPSPLPLQNSFPENPEIFSFLIYELNEVFRRCLEQASPEEAGEFAEAYLLLARWIEENAHSSDSN